MKPVHEAAGSLDRSRLLLASTALVPAAVNLLKGPIAAAGSGAWLCPLLALPVGAFLCWTLGRTQSGGTDWDAARLGVPTAVLSLSWGLVLLFFNMAFYSRRLLLGLNGAGNRPLFLVVSTLLVLYLGRSGPILLRASRLIFPAVAAALAAGVFLAFPAVRLENLDPVGPQGLTEHGLWGLLAGTVQVLSLAGFAAFVLLLEKEPPVRERKGTKKNPSHMRWVIGGCGALTALFLAVVGAFGPGLALRMDEPFLYLVGGTGLAGGLQRGEAVLSTLAALGDLTLLALLSQGCARLWRRLFPSAASSRTGPLLPAAAALLVVLFLPDGPIPEIWAEVVLPVGNLLFGAAIPFLAASAKKAKKTEKKC